MAETKVILTKTVSNLGHSGDVVDVKSGFFLNGLTGGCGLLRDMMFSL